MNPFDRVIEAIEIKNISAAEKLFEYIENKPNFKCDDWRSLSDKDKIIVANEIWNTLKKIAYANEAKDSLQ